MFRIVSYILPDELLKESIAYAENALKNNDNISIRHDFDKTGTVLMHRLSDDHILFDKLKQQISTSTVIDPTMIGFNYMLAGSTLYWHKDKYPMLGSVTIYLNKIWQKDWGGSLMYTDKEDIPDKVEALFPQLNVGVIQTEGKTLHHVTPTSKDAPIRMTIQMFQHTP